jgi:hypothetical protein
MVVVLLLAAILGALVYLAVLVTVQAQRADEERRRLAYLREYSRVAEPAPPARFLG